jgi:hypothetical protein
VTLASGINAPAVPVLIDDTGQGTGYAYTYFFQFRYLRLFHMALHARLLQICGHRNTNRTAYTENVFSDSLTVQIPVIFTTLNTTSSKGLHAFYFAN